METETEPIQKYESSEDMVYFSFITEYGKYIPNDLDKTFSNLMNNIDEYNKYQGNYINLIKENLKLIDNIDFLDTKVTNNYIDFNGRPEENLRLSMLLPKIIKLRQDDDFNTEFIVEKSKTNPKKYLLYDSSGNLLGDEFKAEDLRNQGLGKNVEVADMEGQIGKFDSKAKAFRNKDNEKKQKSGSDK